MGLYKVACTVYVGFIDTHGAALTTATGHLVAALCLEEPGLALQTLPE